MTLIPKNIKYSLVLLGLLLAGAEASAHYNPAYNRLLRELNYICSTRIDAPYGSPDFKACRSYYMTTLTDDYGIALEDILASEITTFLNRTTPIISMCRSSWAGYSSIWGCMRYHDGRYMDDYRRHHPRPHRRALPPARPGVPPHHAVSPRPDFPGHSAGRPPRDEPHAQQHMSHSSTVIINNENSNNNRIKHGKGDAFGGKNHPPKGGPKKR